MPNNPIISKYDPKMRKVFANGTNPFAMIPDGFLSDPADVRTIGNAVPSAKALSFKPGNIAGSSRVPQKIDWKNVAGKMQQGATDLAPFVSNIRNAFVKPPKPIMGKKDNFVTLNRVNLDAARNEVSRSANAMSTAAYRNLPANTAAAVDIAGRGQSINQMSRITETEQNANVGIGNDQAKINASIGASNNAKVDDFTQAGVERKIAQQREQSANWANAGDKVVGIGNEKLKAKVDLDKTRMMSHAYDNSGVYRALRLKAKEAGEPDPLGRDYEDLTDNKRPTYNFTGRTIPTKIKQ